MAPKGPQTSIENVMRFALHVEWPSVGCYNRADPDSVSHIPTQQPHQQPETWSHRPTHAPYAKEISTRDHKSQGTQLLWCSSILVVW